MYDDIVKVHLEAARNAADFKIAVENLARAIEAEGEARRLNERLDKRLDGAISTDVPVNTLAGFSEPTASVGPLGENSDGFLEYAQRARQ